MSTRSKITTHILNISTGKPANGVNVLLEQQISSDKWEKLKASISNQDGRVEDLLAPESVPKTGLYRLTFLTAEYFKLAKTESFYPHVTIVFNIVDPNTHYHVPLLLSPYGYSTYRGS